MKTFNDRFAQDDQHHSFTLTADGCMNRMKDDTPFRELELSDKVERFGSSAEAEERNILNYLSILCSHGLHPTNKETVESFIIKNMDTIRRYSE